LGKNLPALEDLEGFEVLLCIEKNRKFVFLKKEEP
jgi:hypothetical protein